MDDGHAAAHLSFLRRRLAQEFDVRLIALAPGSERPFDERDWADAIVVVERGAVEVECRSGVCRTFASGDVLCLSGLPLCALRNRGHITAVLSAVSRRRGPAESDPAARSDHVPPLDR